MLLFLIFLDLLLIVIGERPSLELLAKRSSIIFFGLRSEKCRSLILGIWILFKTDILHAFCYFGVCETYIKIVIALAGINVRWMTATVFTVLLTKLIS